MAYVYISLGNQYNYELKTNSSMILTVKKVKMKYRFSYQGVRHHVLHIDYFFLISRYNMSHLFLCIDAIILYALYVLHYNDLNDRNAHKD